MTLSGRIALVTGGSRGIGRAVALGLARAGADVALSYRARDAEAAEVAGAIAALGRRAIAVRADAADERALNALAAEVSARLGPVDVLVNNAGIGVRHEIDALTAAIWDETMAINLRAAFLLTQALLPSMRARRFGRLIYMSSTAAQVGGIVGPHYAASKAGLLGLMHGYASQLAREGITANAICPALVETEMITENPRAPRPEAVPVGRFGLPEEVAEMVATIAQNAFVTGQTIQVNGGVYLT